jgi:hypothetical protein
MSTFLLLLHSTPHSKQPAESVPDTFYLTLLKPDIPYIMSREQHPSDDYASWNPSDHVASVVNHLCDTKTLETTRSSIESLRLECRSIQSCFKDMISCISDLRQLGVLQRIQLWPVIQQLTVVKELFKVNDGYSLIIAPIDLTYISFFVK